MTYSWKRFWCPREGVIDLSDDGFLREPDSEWARLAGSELVTLESLLDIPCLILIGEPGIGKSTTIASTRSTVEKLIDARKDGLLWIDLNSYGSEDRLLRKLFDGPEYKSWLNTEKRLHIFLDSFDECLLRIDTLGSILVEELKDKPLHRLLIRIACRTAEWPIALETALRSLWGEEATKVYELTPLRKQDVEEGARANGMPPEEFLKEILQKGVVAFAIKPVTLNFLLKTYQRTGGFPSSQTDLYYRGCLLLCEEQNESRITSGQRGTLSPQNRLRISSRIAAFSIFCKRNAVWYDSVNSDFTGEDLTIEEICSGDEAVDGKTTQIAGADVKEAIGTGLFSSRGANRLGWAHQTYAEFLAAHYVTSHKMSPAQIMSILVHPGDPEGKLVPQLRGTSAWIASMHPEMFSEILYIDPQALLFSDVSSANMEDRANLVEYSLRLVQADALPYWAFSHIHLKQFKHPAIVEQLRPFFTDPSRSPQVRELAIDMAYACNLRETQADLLRIAADTMEPIEIRSNAVAAIGGISDVETRSRLRPIVFGKLDEDANDELKGACLRVLWPDLITPEELFSVLTPLKNEHFLGLYTLFIHNDVVKHLQTRDLPRALAWVENQGSKYRADLSLRGLVNSILVEAWRHLEILEVLNGFARAAYSRLKHHEDIITEDAFGPKLDPPFRDQLRQEDDKRRRLVGALVPSLADPKKDSSILASSGTPLVLSQDLPWLMDQLRETTDEKLKDVYSHLMCYAFNIDDTAQVTAILDACSAEPSLASTFSWATSAVQLDSREAREMQENHKMMRQWQRERQQRAALEPPPEQRIILLLNKFESGELNAWWQLNREMTLGPYSHYYGDQLEADLTKLPGWDAADIAVRSRIVEAAKRYIVEMDPEPAKWIKTNVVYYPDFAGYRAFRLLMEEAEEFFLAIPADVWKKWASVIIAYPTSSGLGNEGPNHQLVSAAYRNAPHEIIDTLLLLIDKENKEGHHIFITRKLTNCWDGRLGSAVFEKAKDNNLNPNCRATLLEALIDHADGNAEEYTKSLLSLPLPREGEGRDMAILAGQILVIHKEDAGWNFVWPAIQSDSAFGRDLILTVAHRSDSHDASAVRSLSEEQVADLYIWLEHEFPRAEDPRIEGGHAVSARESVAEWRDAVLALLRKKGTTEAVQQIQRLMRELPHLTFLKRTALSAEEDMRRKTWIPPVPREFIKLANDDQSRLVQNGDQLLEVICESLKRMETRLHGSIPRVQFLWDKLEGGEYRPKDEESFSDYVAAHLEEDLKVRGIIVNREVQIRRRLGDTPGQQTDIRVDATTAGQRHATFDSLSVFVEVKGSWNDDLTTAMKTQLADRYLKQNQCQHGLYLVGWFDSTRWSESDRRKKQVQGMSPEDLRKQLQTQAVSLSAGGIQIRSMIIDAQLR
jgi:predicted NACHT family NTPase